MKQKRPLVLFGIGKAFAYVSKQEVLADLFPEHGVVAIADNNPAAERKIFRVGSDEIRVAKNSSAFWRDLHHAYPAGADVFITSTKYQREIKEELTGAGIPASSILDHEKVMSAYYKRVFGGDAMQGRGIEIGGPTRMFQGIYAKCSSCDNVNFASDNMWNRNAPPECTSVFRKIIINEATDLRDIESGTYDFLLSSHNLEHTANPLKALREFQRVLRPGGMMLLILPDKTLTFDHNRPYTTMEHLLADERQDVDEHDMTHLEEILKHHDLSMDVPMTYEEFVRRCLANYQNRGMHHHVFSLDLLKEIAAYFHWTVEVCCRMTTGLMLKARVVQ